jgi:hypothetical protein
LRRQVVEESIARSDGEESMSHAMAERIVGRGPAVAPTTSLANNNRGN